jgi:hypothetical protein
MGNYAHLLLSNTAQARTKAELVEASPIFSAKYHLPIVWLSLFDASDIAMVKDYTSNRPDNKTISMPYPVRSKSSALALMNERRAWITAAFPKLEIEWVDEFERILNRYDNQYVYLDSREICIMVAPTSEAWSVELRRMLGMFEEVAPRFDPSVENLSLPFEEAMARIERSGWDNYVLRFGTPDLGSRANAFGFTGARESVS